MKDALELVSVLVVALILLAAAAAVIGQAMPGILFGR
jgi:hypothetical protein